MSVRREVVSLSQLLRRNEKAHSSRGNSHMTSLPLVSSRRKAEAMLSAEKKIAPVAYSQRVLDASRVVTPQPELGVSIYGSNDLTALSHEVYEAESEKSCAMTSMSQSSISQSQSQNLLGPSQDNQIHRLQQLQTLQALSTHQSPPRCDSSGKLQEISSNLTQAFVAQNHGQNNQQKEILTQFVNQIKNMIMDFKATGQEQQLIELKKIETSISNMAESVTELRQQGFGACEKKQMATTDDISVIKAAMLALQAKVEIVEGGVSSCSGLLKQIIGAESRKYEEFLLAFLGRKYEARPAN
ncbi:uncharacterized protein PHALS_14031 [Plasmopara halstedii]|uniref:Uncharacterized protein n=1 Tax=Plasmopara halstedii TaxID=4781 RepID=A0A0P1AQA6_PLAHL|nr:uncharacterized protein PHALS_14031 [Plasmopara halstedii]CEG43738.1 hypothetical protein PHALS_14031 [Plasmopara halstedii]|eukprot:XP_024580107.1 hypothetical protein PHALS_14031 [Plasmopara halstedii]